MAPIQDAEALSIYLNDLQNQVRGPTSSLAAAVRVLAEPLSFLGVLVFTTGSDYVRELPPQWAGPVEPTPAKQLYFIQHLLPNHLDFILDNITIDWFSALPSAQQTSLFDAYFVSSSRRVPIDSHEQDQGQQEHQKKHIRPMMSVVSLQILVSRIHGRQFQENHSFLNATILRLLKKLLETISLQDFYVGCSLFTSPSGAVETRTSVEYDTLWDTFLSKLFSIPTRVSNALGGATPTRVEIQECFQEAIFYQRFASQLQSCLDDIAAETTKDGEEMNMQKNHTVAYTHRARAFGSVIAKFLRLGYGKILVESLVSTLWGRNHSLKAAGWKLALAHLSSPSIAHLFLGALVEYLDRHQLNFKQGIRGSMTKGTGTTSTSAQSQLAAVHNAANMIKLIGFGAGQQYKDEKSNSSSSNSESGDKNQDAGSEAIDQVLFQGRVYGVGVLRMLICIQSGWPTNAHANKDSVLLKTFKKALTIWSDPMFISHSSVDYQKYISYQILLMLGYFSPQVLIEADLIPVFGAGVSNWLEMESFQRKQIGLIVAEEFSKAVDTIGAPADFDLDISDPEIQFSRSLVHLKDGAQPYKPECPSSSESAEDSNEDSVLEDFHDMHVSAGGFNDSDDEEDPDAIVESFSVTNTYGGDSDSINSDEDDLKPYAMEYESDPDEDMGPAKKAKVAAPLYLRDLVSYLRASEDRDKIDIGLRTATELIRRKTGSLELEEFAEILANVLVNLMDNFELPNFYKMRENALVALVVTSPVIVAGVLTSQFYEKKNSLGQRLNILTALTLGAKELAGFDRPTDSSISKAPQKKHPYSPSGTTAASSTSTLIAQQQPATFSSVVSSISLERTRRFSRKSQIEASRPAPKANAFSNLAPVFLGGLLGRWGGNRGAGMERGYDVLQKAPAILLKKFVIALGVLVHYAGNSPHLLPITRELFQFLLALRYYTPSVQSMSGPRSTSSSSSAFSAPSLTSLTLPRDIEISTRPGPTEGTELGIGRGGGELGGPLSNLLSTRSQQYNPDLLESILFDLLILVTPSSTALSDSLLLHEFYAEIMECQQWAMELWEIYKLEPGETGDDDKSRMYCAALLQRCFELVEVSM
ncbi:telomere binding protein [Lobosporangium transversale]|uniref:Telomere length regulation protein-domain-containing protein n=1 Tax=Lobosporangium transversale TaxID=64571 RepID=A0A1Y2H5M0_9FUNG|nr:telomere length regulation protein-domain-containing protein [Lobosporangium transversale]KAF9912870.1 telomere binding protein [Lobosporangium transversale]ORZ28993.1 telomere length regulation protein-domain-containing protein [Lobosporangium transversale]|eukprot:XP_021886666.1 telomere length regulation protein-domain-containing protein [Lobosporangium transversale]